MPTNPAAEADAVAVLAGADALAGPDPLAGAVAAAAVLAGAEAGGLALLGGELLQPAAKPIRPAKSAARTAAAPMAISFLFMVFLCKGLAWLGVTSYSCEPRAPAVQQALKIRRRPKKGFGDPHLFPCCGSTPL
jgi:hypothetical protein